MQPDIITIVVFLSEGDAEPQCRIRKTWNLRDSPFFVSFIPGSKPGIKAERVSYPVLPAPGIQFKNKELGKGHRFDFKTDEVSEDLNPDNNFQREILVTAVPGSFRLRTSEYNYGTSFSANADHVEILEKFGWEKF